MINDVEKLRKSFYPNTEINLKGAKTTTLSRASTARQGENLTHEIQEDWISSMIKKHGLVPSGKIHTINETAFKHNKRIKFMKLMLELIQQKKHTGVDHISLYSTSRATRNQESKCKIEQMIFMHDFVFLFAREELVLHKNSPKSDWDRWNNYCDINQSQSENTRRDAIEGHLKLIEKGIFPGHAPWGYQNFIYPDKDETPGFAPIQELVPYIRKAFELFATGVYSIELLRKQLDKLFRGTIRQKLPVSKNLGKILRNPFYYGDFIYKEKVHHGNPRYQPAIISKPLWLKVQSILKKNPIKGGGEKHPYTGLLKCGGHILTPDGGVTMKECGKAISGDPQKGQRYWSCSSNAENHCSMKDNAYLQKINLKKETVKDFDIEKFFQEHLEKIKFSSDLLTWINTFSKKIIFDENDFKENSIKALKANITKKEALAKSLYREKVEAVSTYEKLQAEDTCKEVLEEIKHLKIRHDKLLAEKTLKNSKIEGILNLLRDIGNMFRNASQGSKANLISALTENRKLLMTKFSADYPSHIQWITQPKQEI